MTAKTRISLVRPDDWHLHIRDYEAMAAVVPHTARQFARAIIMPNLKPPVSSTVMALAYRERILACIPEQYSFMPLMTLYLTEETSKEEIKQAKESGYIYGAKLYPAGATTHSDAGVTDVKNIYPILEAMEQHGLPLLVHGESTDPEVDVFDREKVFIEKDLAPAIEKFPELNVVLEHITTADAVHFVSDARKGVAATVTAHHLLMNRNEIFRNGIRPHNYCLPVLKREQHRQALLTAATSGNPKFFLGTDSAPHPKTAKESACGCAGIYTAHAAIELYTEAFEQAGALDKLESFAGFHGPDFYGLPRNTDTITLERESWTVPAEYSLGNDTVVPLRANEEIHWKLVE